MRDLARTAVAALVCLALFSLAFSLLAENGLWPPLPTGALHNTDLDAGFVGAALVLLLLLRRAAAGAVSTASERATAHGGTGEDVPGRSVHEIE